MFGVVVRRGVDRCGRAARADAGLDQRLWTGTWEEHDAWEGSARVGRSQAQISLRLRPGPGRIRGAAVGLPPPDVERGVGRAPLRLRWPSWTIGAPDERGFTYESLLGGHRHDPARAAARWNWARRRRVGGRPHAGAEGAAAGHAASRRISRANSASPPPSVTRDARAAAGARHAERRRAHRLRLRKTWPKGGRPAGSFSVSVVGAGNGGHGGRPGADERLRPIRAGAGRDADIHRDGAGRHRAFPVRAGSGRTPALRRLRDQCKHRRRLFRDTTCGQALDGSTVNDGPDVIFDPTRFRNPRMVARRVARRRNRARRRVLPSSR